MSLFFKKPKIKGVAHTTRISDLIKIISIIKDNPFCTFRFIYKNLYDFNTRFTLSSVRQALIFLEHYGIIKMVKIRNKGDMKSYLFIR